MRVGLEGSEPLSPPPCPQPGSHHHHPSPARTVPLPGSHRKLQHQWDTPHPPGLGWAWARLGLAGRSQTANPPPRPGPRRALGSCHRLSLRGCGHPPAGRLLPAPKPPRPPSPRRPAPPAGRAHLHTVIRFLRSTATLREDAFLEDSPRAMVVRTKLASIQMCSPCGRCQLPLTPASPPDHGWAFRPSGPLDPSMAIPRRLRGCRPPRLPPQAAIREQNKAGEGALRGAEPGPVPPFL